MKDLRDPQKLGETYLEARRGGVDKALAVRLPADDFDGAGPMSSDPELHHSKTPQNEDLQNQGGE